LSVGAGLNTSLTAPLTVVLSAGCRSTSNGLCVAGALETFVEFSVTVIIFIVAEFLSVWPFISDTWRPRSVAFTSPRAGFADPLAGVHTCGWIAQASLVLGVAGLCFTSFTGFAFTSDDLFVNLTIAVIVEVVARLFGRDHFTFADIVP
tara:strand:- start:522 stop:968 length:447 start_codon:yes stop_codon:yes gene_type:complete